MFNDPSTNVYYDYKIQEDILHNIELELSNYITYNLPYN